MWNYKRRLRMAVESSVLQYFKNDVCYQEFKKKQPGILITSKVLIKNGSHIILSMV